MKERNKKVIVYQATHSQVCIPSYDYVIPIQVGAEQRKERVADFIDSIGENISYKNPEYCELTALYWAWKNQKSEVLGLCHYRRIFLLKSPEEILHILEQSDCIVPHPYFFRISLEREYKKFHIKEDYERMMRILEKEYSDYYETAIEVFRQNKLYPYNMFLMKWELADAYCAWLFPLLQKLETKEIERTNYQNRYIGFLAERLFNVYIRHNKLRVKECDIQYEKKGYEKKVKLYSVLNQMFFEIKKMI